MRLDTRPLLDHPVDAGLFVNRTDETEKLLRAARGDLNAVVFGERGAGKTSLLRHVSRGLREEGQPAVLVDTGLADSPEGVLSIIREALGRAPHLGTVLQDNMRRAMLPPLAPGRDAIDLVQSLRVEGDARAILLIDNLPSPQVGYTIFGKLRDELWRLPHTWIVAASPSDRQVLLAPPADAFFATSLELRPLPPDAQRDLLRRRLEDDESQLPDGLLDLTEGNPRKLLELARELVLENRSAQGLAADQAKIETAVSELGRPASMLFSELQALGSASASDTELLSRLGWTRPRANQVLRHLEENGFVVGEDERAEGRGRPRRVYRPIKDMTGRTR